MKYFPGAYTIIRLTVGVNLGGCIGHAFFGNPYAAVGHLLLGAVGAIFLAHSTD